MNAKKCLKCGHVANYDAAPPQACPSCGAIYTKVEEALRQRQEVRTQPSREATSEFRNTVTDQPSAARMTRPQGGGGADVHAFAQRMRDESLYPAWRKIVGVSTIFCYVIAALILLVAIISSKGSFLGVLVGAGSAAVIVIIAKVGKELSLMVADLSDAAVRMAAGKERV